MTIDEAIDMIASILKDREPYEGGLGNDALNLGIEALKAVAKMRHYPFPDEILQLPGETED